MLHTQEPELMSLEAVHLLLERLSSLGMQTFDTSFLSTAIEFDQIRWGGSKMPTPLRPRSFSQQSGDQSPKGVSIARQP
jgi:hypothetical protein